MLIAQVAEIAGTTTADVHRVLSHGGTSQTDWAIAHAIEQVTGRDPYELMLTAGRQAEVARIWADTGTPAEAPASTNPNAVHDPTVTIYEEHTAPDAPQAALPDHPNTTDDQVDDLTDQSETDQSPERTWEHFLHTHVWADVAALTGASPGEICCIIRPWTTARDAITGMTALLARRRADRTPNTSTITAVLAA